MIDSRRCDAEGRHEAEDSEDAEEARVHDVVGFWSFVFICGWLFWLLIAFMFCYLFVIDQCVLFA